MAVDEMLMEAQAAAPDPVPTLRFYAWSSPCYTLGYFQDVAAVAAGRAGGLPVVRRLTGGGLVRHDKDLTFALVLPHPNAFLPADVKGSYLRVNSALLRGLKPFYPELDFADCKTVPSGRGSGERVCFEAPACYDLLLGGRRKVVGASQRRRGGALLHQSAVFLDGSHEELARRIAEGFRREWGVTFEERALEDGELAAAQARCRERYRSPEWASAHAAA